MEIYSHSFAAHGFPPLPEYEEPLVSPLSRPDIAAEYPLVLTNAKFTTYIHSQLRGLASLRKASPDPTADIHPETAKPYGITDKEWMIIESPARLDSRQSARHRRHRTGCGVLPAWLVAGMQRAGAARLRFLRCGLSQSKFAYRLGCLRSDQRLAAAPLLSLPRALSGVESSTSSPTTPRSRGCAGLGQCCFSQARTSSAFLSGGKTG